MVKGGISLQRIIPDHDQKLHLISLAGHDHFVQYSLSKTLKQHKDKSRA